MPPSRAKSIASDLAETFGRETFTHQDAIAAGIEIPAGMMKRLHAEGFTEIVGQDGKLRRRYSAYARGPTTWRIRPGAVGALKGAA
jgi:hypothetical protein